MPRRREGEGRLPNDGLELRRRQGAQRRVVALLQIRTRAVLERVWVLLAVALGLLPLGVRPDEGALLRRIFHLRPFVLLLEFVHHDERLLVPRLPNRRRFEGRQVVHQKVEFTQLLGLLRAHRIQITHAEWQRAEVRVLVAGHGVPDEVVVVVDDVVPEAALAHPARHDSRRHGRRRGAVFAEGRVVILGVVPVLVLPKNHVAHDVHAVRV
mmetsp:Transcript_24386/g.75283  ORF Transcript_24386/g.75283 Transcript_24386/m.75283 type:complete len:211 (+) Transcript_24386:279-911(+)